MSRYPLNLPDQLKRDAAQWAERQGVSLNQFIVWAVSEKVGGLKLELHDPNFPGIEYRIGASGWPMPVLRGTGLRVQTLLVAHQTWGMTKNEIADEWDIALDRVEEALGFAKAHQSEIEAALVAEERLERVVA